MHDVYESLLSLLYQGKVFFFVHQYVRVKTRTLIERKSTTKRKKNRSNVVLKQRNRVNGGRLYQKEWHLDIFVINSWSIYGQVKN